MDLHEAIECVQRHFVDITPEFTMAWGFIRANIVEDQKPPTNIARDEILPGMCPICHGCGNVIVSHVNTCLKCSGTGKTSPVA